MISAFNGWGFSRFQLPGLQSLRSGRSGSPAAEVVNDEFGDCLEDHHSSGQSALSLCCCLKWHCLELCIWYENLKNIQLDLYTHPFASQIILLRMALLNEEQEKLVGIGFDDGAMESDVLGDMNLSGLGLRNSSTYGSQLYDVVNKSNMTGKQFNGLLDLIIIRRSTSKLTGTRWFMRTRKLERLSGNLLAECFFNIKSQLVVNCWFGAGALGFGAGVSQSRRGSQESEPLGPKPALFPNSSFEWVSWDFTNVGPTKSWTFLPGFSLRIAMISGNIPFGKESEMLESMATKIWWYAYLVAHGSYS